MRLDFICVGPQRTASSWLDTMLRQHCEIVLPGQVKEAFYWDRYYHRGWAWHHKHFVTSGSGLLGEVAPTLFHLPEATQRLVEHNRDMRIVVCLRDPVERAYSLFCHHLAKGRVQGPLSRAVSTMPEILESSRYAKHSSRWIEAFGASNVFFVRHTDVQADPMSVLDKLCRFLDLRPVEWLNPSKPVGARTAPRSRLFARVMSRGATWLRGRGLHGVAEFGKSIGLKRAAFSGGTPVQPLDGHARRELEQVLLDDIRWVSSIDATGTADRVLQVRA